MPTYQYICAKCGHEFEKVQSISEQALTVCPKELCARKKWGKGRVRRQISTGGGLIFKGSGFYITDYRSEGYKEAAKKESTGNKPAAADNKPAPAKPESKPTPPPKADK